MTAVDEAMTAEETLADFEREAEIHLMNFIRRLPFQDEEKFERPNRSAVDEDVDEFDTGGDFFKEARLDEMLARLDAVLGIPETLGNFEREARIHFWRFSNRLQQGRLAPEQVDRVAAYYRWTGSRRYYDGVKEKHPDAAEMIDDEIFVVRNLVPGNVAPKR